MFNTPWKPKLVGKDYARMDSFLPLAIQHFNVNDDIGLLETFYYLDTFLFKDFAGKIFVKADVNIFYRIYKVLQHTLFAIYLTFPCTVS